MSMAALFLTYALVFWVGYSIAKRIYFKRGHKAGFWTAVFVLTREAEQDAEGQSTLHMRPEHVNAQRQQADWQ